MHLISDKREFSGARTLTTLEEAVPSSASLTLHQRQYWAWVPQRKAASGSVESLASCA